VTRAKCSSSCALLNLLSFAEYRGQSAALIAVTGREGRLRGEDIRRRGSRRTRDKCGDI
jgi:hypothetical protein